MQIYLNKLLPILLLPVGFTILMLLFGLFSKRRLFILAASIVLYASSTPIVSNFMIRSAEGGAERIHSIDAPKADAIVVLSGGRLVAPGPAAVSEWSDANRFYGGVELFQAGKAPLLVFTGGWSPWEPNAKPEGDILIKYAEALGISKVNMQSTSAVINTAEEARAVSDLLLKTINVPNKFDEQYKILLVTSAFHMPRAQRLFELENLHVIPFPVDFKVSASREFNILDLLPSAMSLVRTELALREFYGRFFYWIKGRLDSAISD
jgi:uncharacterized SAM-binding protein YcdF (DUF218 family)